jgi:hypothetical protein
MRSLGLTSAQAAVLNAGSEECPKLLVYVFDKRVRTEMLKVRRWQGIPVEVVRMKRVQPHEAGSAISTAAEWAGC